MRDTLNKYILLVLTVLLTANMFTGITNSLTLSFLIIASQLFCLRKEDSAIVFMLLGSVFGSFYAQEGVRFIGSILIWGSAIFMFKDLISYKNNWFSNFWPLCIFIFVVLFSIITTTGGNYSGEKFIAMLMNIVTYTIAFSHLILFQEKHSFGNIGLMFVLYSLFLLGYMNELMGIKASLNSLLYSFAGFRNEINDYIAGDKDVFHINYQSIGIYGCIGLIFTLFSVDKTSKRFNAFVIFLSALVVWYAAARQAILLYAIIWLTYLSVYKGLKFKNLLLILLFIVGGYTILSSLDSQSLEFLLGSTEGKDSARDNIMQTAMSQFYDNPLMGVGFGRFHINGEFGCNEHNLFVELLAEMGVIGFLIFIWSAIKPLIKSYNLIKQNIQTISPFILILLSYFLRSMVSADLRETIAILIIILCIQMSCNNKAVTI